MEAVYIQLSRYLIPLTIVFGSIGAIANQVLFHYRKSLRTTSCALYFRALSANDFFVLWFVMLSQWFRDQFQLDASLTSEWYCKFSQYLVYTSYALSPYFLVLACFDRLCTSSTNVRLRKLATLRIASCVIPAMVIIILLTYSFMPYWCQLVPISSDMICAIVDPTFRKVLAITLMLIFCSFPPILMMIFCSFTWFLLRQQRHRIMPINQARLRHRDAQLLKMLFIYVTLNIFFIAPFTITYFLEIYYYNNFSPFTNPLVLIFILLTNITYATSFYAYTLSTPFYRDELLNLLRDIWQRIHRNGHIGFHLQRRIRPHSTTT